MIEDASHMARSLFSQTYALEYVKQNIELNDTRCHSTKSVESTFALGLNVLHQIHLKYKHPHVSFLLLILRRIASD